MKITLSPIRSDSQLTLSCLDDVLTINGEDFDFTPLPDGATLPRDAVACAWLAEDVTRDAQGLLTVPLLLPHGAEAPSETLFPQPILAQNGPIPLPPYAIPPTTEVTDED
jgi:hypothetical protein